LVVESQCVRPPRACRRNSYSDPYLGRYDDRQAYFINQDQDPQRLDCTRVDAVNHTVPRSVAAARAALEKLLAGPTATEKQAGFMTVINPGVTVASLSIQDGVAHVTFSRELQEGVGGSCRVTTIRSQIEQTLMQFPSVTSVRISVEGYADDEVLQP
jgi:spore germination protein GerM